MHCTVIDVRGAAQRGMHSLWRAVCKRAIFHCWAFSYHRVKAFIWFHFVRSLFLPICALYMLYYALLLSNQSTKIQLNYARILAGATVPKPLQQSPERSHAWFFSMQHQCNVWCNWECTLLVMEPWTPLAAQCGRQWRGPDPNFSQLHGWSCAHIYMAPRDNSALSSIRTRKPFLSNFSCIPQCCLRDGWRTVAGLVVKSTWIIIPGIRSRNPASAFVITFISCQGHNSGKVSNGAIRAKVHEPFRICDKYRWGNETRRNRLDIKMVFVLADKSLGSSENPRASHQNEDCWGLEPLFEWHARWGRLIY